MISVMRSCDGAQTENFTIHNNYINYNQSKKIVADTITVFLDSLQPKEIFDPITNVYTGIYIDSLIACCKPCVMLLERGVLISSYTSFISLCFRDDSRG